MGVCFSTFDPAAHTTSSHIDTKLSQEAHYDKSLHKLLFLGPGASGKSTIFRQLQWLHGGGMDDLDLIEFKTYIDFQVILQMKQAIKYYLSDPVENELLQNAINKIISYDRKDQLTSEIANTISYIWQNDARLKDIFRIHHTKKILDESTEYFWNSMDRISAPDYKPNKTDVINVRNMSTGIVDKKFSIKKLNLHIFDVGGQKCERKKWFRSFDSLEAIVFVVAISCYNEVLFEDNRTNAMVDALDLFDKTIHHQMFVNTPIILFLNKKDLFEDKIKDIPITECPAFADFAEKEHNNALYLNKDPNDYIQTSDYIQETFKNINKNGKRKVFTHLTCAMDHENIKNVFGDIADIFLQNIATQLRNGQIL